MSSTPHQNITDSSKDASKDTSKDWHLTTPPPSRDYEAVPEAESDDQNSFKVPAKSAFNRPFNRAILQAKSFKSSGSSDSNVSDVAHILVSSNARSIAVEYPNLDNIRPSGRKSLSCPHLSVPQDRLQRPSFERSDSQSRVSSGQCSVIMKSNPDMPNCVEPCTVTNESSGIDRYTVYEDLLNIVKSRLTYNPINDALKKHGLVEEAKSTDQRYLLLQRDVNEVLRMIQTALESDETENKGPQVSVSSPPRHLSITEKGVLMIQPRASAELGTTLQDIQTNSVLENKKSHSGDMPQQQPVGPTNSLSQKTLKDFARATRHGACHPESDTLPGFRHIGWRPRVRDSKAMDSAPNDLIHGKLGSIIHGWKLSWRTAGQNGNGARDVPAAQPSQVRSECEEGRSIPNVLSQGISSNYTLTTANPSTNCVRCQSNNERRMSQSRRRSSALDINSPFQADISYPASCPQHQRVRSMSTPRSIIYEGEGRRLSHFGSVVVGTPERRKSSYEPGPHLNVAFSPGPPKSERKKPWVKVRKDSAYPQSLASSVLSRQESPW